jgi:hypothetical protein
MDWYSYTEKDLPHPQLLSALGLLQHSKRRQAHHRQQTAAANSTPVFDFGSVYFVVSAGV